MNPELTLESLAQRVEALERALTLKLTPRRQKDWRRVVGMFGDSDFMKQVDAEGQAIRAAERTEAQRAESTE
jgi:hypothetical protein